MTKYVERHNQAVLQSQMTAEEALAWARRRYEDTSRWPSTRFRVEMSRVGPSKLLTNAKALLVAQEYGGRVVELIHSIKVEKRQRKRNGSSDDGGELS